jgi:hypothetical protein
MTTTTEATAMNKAEIIAELENMVAARLFGPQPLPADRETCSAVVRKLQMGLVEQVRDESLAWQITPLGKELNVELFEVFMGIIYEWDVPIILKEYGLLDESEFDSILESTSDADAKSLLDGYVKRAYFDYHKAVKFSH